MFSKIFITAFIALFSFQATPSWQTDFSEAQALAQREHKMILLNFAGSDWCAPCIKLKKEIFEKDAFRTYAQKHLVLVRADFPRLKKNQLPAEQMKKNEQLAEQYNNQGKFPLTLLLDENGKVLYTWDGFQAVTPEEFVQQIKKASGV